MTNFKTTVRADCAVSARSPLPPSIKALAPWLSVRESAFGQESALPPPNPVAGIQNKANFPFHQLASLLAFELRAAGRHFRLQMLATPCPTIYRVMKDATQRHNRQDSHFTTKCLSAIKRNRWSLQPTCKLDKVSGFSPFNWFSHLFINFSFRAITKIQRQDSFTSRLGIRQSKAEYGAAEGFSPEHQPYTLKTKALVPIHA